MKIPWAAGVGLVGLDGAVGWRGVFGMESSCWGFSRVGVWMFLDGGILRVGFESGW